MPVTGAEIHRIVQDVITRRGVADRGMLDDAWRQVLLRIALDLHLGPYEGICRPLIVKIIDAWCDLVPYLHMPEKTMHPFFKPEGETKFLGILTGAREIVADIRRVVAEFPGTRDATVRWGIMQHLERTGAKLEHNVAIVRDICSRTEDPRKTSPENRSVGHMVITTKEFRNVQRVYQELLSIVIGKEAEAFFREQYELAESILRDMSLVCDVRTDGPVH